MNRFIDRLKSNRTNFFCASLVVMLNIVAVHANAAPLVWGTGLWGDTWDDVDTDGDGLKDSEETNVYFTNPLRADTDADTLPDGWEVTHSRNPLVADYSVDVGAVNTCALDDSGVKCWGSTDYNINTVPVLVSPVAVTVGDTHACALDAVGVHCWGDNYSGQTTVPALVNPRAVSAGAIHTCALDDSGVHCWGDNSVGQTTVPTLVNPIAVNAGIFHTCALDDNGVHCWGGNGFGQTNVPILINPVAVAAGNLHTCALNDTGVVCWGDNTWGQITVPVLVNPIAVSAGDSNACALDDTGVVCWGNTDGQNDVPTLMNPAAVSAGAAHTCVLDDTGVVCWGYNAYGQTDVPALTIDPDGDGIPSWWEIKYGLNRLDASDANGDLDGDGITNYREYLRGTDPTNVSNASNDFGGDHKADVLLRNTTTGDWTLASLNGLTVLNQSTVGAFSDIENVIVSTGDFDGDGDADILTRGTDNGLLPGTFRVELTAGATVTDSAWLFTMSTDTSDVVMSTKDFNKDGKADVLLRNSATGVWTINYMQGTSDPTIGTLNASTDICYTMNGDGDYDGNGYPDLLLRKDNCGGASYPWLINTTDGDATILASGTAAGISMSMAWGALVADKDFNGDGKDDLLIRALTGSVQQWLLYDMDGINAPSASGLLNIAVQSMWQFAADADFNGDGKDDIVLRSTDTGQWYGYLLDGRTLLGSGVINMAMNPIWILQALDDFSGDGKSDILLRNSANGQWYLNLMNGLTVQTKGVLSITTDLSYTLQND